MARLVALLLLAPFAASAEAPDYERRLVQSALDRTGRVPDPAPKGKVLEEVIVASEDIFAESDPFPDFLNLFHRLTREEVVRREVLLTVGAPYDEAAAAETERILRSRFIFAVARVVPVVGRKGGVAALVVTKDRWSLRLNSEYATYGPALKYLRLYPTEANFLGLDQQLNLLLFLELDTLQLGQAFEDRRFLGSRLSLTETAVVFFNRATLEAEGTSGGVGFGRRLFALDDTWGLWGQASWDLRTYRAFCGLAPCEIQPDGPGEPVARVYDRRRLGGQVLYTRSLGRSFKTNLSAGAGAYSYRYGAPASAPLSDEQRALLEANLPRSEDALYLTAQLNAYEARYRVLHDIDTFSLSEDFQLGWRTLLQARWANPAFLSPSRFFEAGASVRYRLLASDDLASFAAAASARAQGGWVNKHVAAEVSNVSPSLHGFGRLVARAMVDLVADDLDHRVVALGGDNGLRGAAAGAFLGRNYALWNLELRTRSVELETVYVGLVFFWDAGSAFDAAPSFTHTLGTGVRILLPQFNQETIRIDFGMVLGGPQPPFWNRFTSSFGQVTDLHPGLLDSPL